MPNPIPDPERVALVALTRLVRARHGKDARLVSATYDIEHPIGLRESVSLTRLPDLTGQDDADACPPEPARQDSGPGGELRRRVVELLRLADRPMKGSIIARRLDRVGSSYLRTVLAQLVHAGVLVKVPERGYWLASKGPVPE